MRKEVKGGKCGGCLQVEGGLAGAPGEALQVRAIQSIAQVASHQRGPGAWSGPDAQELARSASESTSKNVSCRGSRLKRWPRSRACSAERVPSPLHTQASCVLTSDGSYTSLFQVVSLMRATGSSSAAMRAGQLRVGHTSVCVCAALYGRDYGSGVDGTPETLILWDSMWSGCARCGVAGFADETR